ncbi:MAG TPA: tetratricopeptide repeat protein [Hanamia sp.]|nr:tetratricopeptide repeat protein [Hanamia sp.]
MYKLFFLIFFSVFTQIGAAQNPADVDSLNRILNDKSKPDDSNRVRTILNLANILIYTNPDSAMKYSEEALQIAQKLQWQKGIALSLRQQGYVYYVSSDYVKAMDYCIRALKVAERMNNDIFNASIYNNIGNIYADLKNYSKAMDYYSRYLAIAGKINSKVDEMNALINIGDIRTEMNDSQKGLEYFNRALSIATQLNNKRISAAILNNIGEIYLKQKNEKEASVYFQKCLSLSAETNNENAKATALNSLAEIYLHQRNYKQAVAFSRRSLQLSKELNDLGWQANAYETLSKTYEAKKNFEEALYNYKQSDLLKDSLLNGQKKQEITSLEMKYNFDRKEAEIKAAADKTQALAAAELNRQKVLKNSSLGIAVLLVLLGISGVVLYKRRKDTLEKKKEAEFNAQVAYTEMKALRAQMNPHFIFNSLNSINDYIDKHDTTTATLYTTRFAKLMRMILENSEQKEILLSEDLKALELYMQLESMRMENKFDYQIKVDEDIDPENTLIPPLILQPFVENSIWHGISKKQGPGKILISIKKEGNMINCIVEDNGIGMKESAVSKTENENQSKKSLGMKITKARIDIMNKMKKSNAKITESNLEEGTKIEIQLPEELAF